VNTNVNIRIVKCRLNSVDVDMLISLMAAFPLERGSFSMHFVENVSIGRPVEHALALTLTKTALADH
jgi:hypothetical protein